MLFLDTCIVLAVVLDASFHFVNLKYIAPNVLNVQTEFG